MKLTYRNQVNLALQYSCELHYDNEIREIRIFERISVITLRIRNNEKESYIKKD